MSRIKNESRMRTDDEITRIAFDSTVVRFQAVRSEVLQRIWIQNSVIGLVWLAAVTAALACHFLPRSAWTLATAFNGLALGATVIWMHSDIRLMQLARYLTDELEPVLARGSTGWEDFHHRLRPQSRMGSLWGVSTKGILMGSQLVVAMTAAGQMYRSSDRIGVCALGCLGAAISYYFTRAPKLATRQAA